MKRATLCATQQRATHCRGSSRTEMVSRFFFQEKEKKKNCQLDAGFQPQAKAEGRLIADVEWEGTI
jgi:hypothetical protein